MKYSIAAEGTNIVVTLDGRLDHSSVGTLDDAMGTIKEMNPSAVTFDLAQVSSIDSVGLGMLVGIRSDMKGRTLSLRNPQPIVSRLLDLTDARTMFHIVG